MDGEGRGCQDVEGHGQHAWGERERDGVQLGCMGGGEEDARQRTRHEPTIAASTARPLPPLSALPLSPRPPLASFFRGPARSADIADPPCPHESARRTHQPDAAATALWLSQPLQRGEPAVAPRHHKHEQPYPPLAEPASPSRPPLILPSASAPLPTRTHRRPCSALAPPLRRSRRGRACPQY